MSRTAAAYTPRMVVDGVRETPAAALLAAVNAATFLALTAATDLQDTLGITGGWEAVTARPWTPLTAMFTSGHLLHVLAAIAVLLLFGRALERITGSLHLVAVYLLSGLAGSAVFVLGGSPDDLALGASAAFLGVVGALAVVQPTSVGLDLPKILAAILIVNVALPLLGLGSWSSSLAHLAGIAVGAAYVRIAATGSG